MSTTLSKRSTRQRRAELLSYVALGHKLAAWVRPSPSPTRQPGSPAACQWSSLWLLLLLSGGLTSFQFVNARALNTAKDKQSSQAEPGQLWPCGRGKSPESQSDSTSGQVRHARMRTLHKYGGGRRPTARLANIFSLRTRSASPTILLMSRSPCHGPVPGSIQFKYLVAADTQLCGCGCGCGYASCCCQFICHIAFTARLLIPGDFHICMSAFNDRPDASDK